MSTFTLGCPKSPELLLTSQHGTREVCWSRAVAPVMDKAMAEKHSTKRETGLL